MLTAALIVIALACLPLAVQVAGVLVVWTITAVVWIFQSWRGLMFTLCVPLGLGLTGASVYNIAITQDRVLGIRLLAIAFVSCALCLPFIAKVDRENAAYRKSAE